MAFQLEDLLRDDKKDANLIPDLSKATCNSAEELRRLMECCPEFKMKPEKVRKEDTKVRDKDFSWRTTRKELRNIHREWNYGDPVPPDMRVLNLQELHQVPIDWRMLTPLRPKLRQDEELFSRLVEIGKLQAKTQAREKKSIVNPIQRAKNRAGIIESTVKICGDCGEEFCTGDTCGHVLYDAFIRVTVQSQKSKPVDTADAAAIIANMGNTQGKSKNSKRKRNAGANNNSRSEKKGKSVKLVVRKSKVKIKSTRKASDKSEEGNNPEIGKKFTRKCSKYHQRKKLSTSSKK